MYFQSIFLSNLSINSSQSFLSIIFQYFLLSLSFVFFFPSPYSNKKIKISKQILKRKNWCFFNLNTKFWKWKKKWLVYLNKWMKELSLIQFWILKTFKFFRSILKWFIQTHAQEIQWILAYCKMHILNYSTKHNHELIQVIMEYTVHIVHEDSRSISYSKWHD